MTIAMFVIVLLLVFFIWFLGNRPKKYLINNIEDLSRFLAGLLDQFTDGSVLIVRHKRTKYFIQFAKYIDDNDKVNLHFGFPDAPWSRAFWGRVKDVFDKERIDYKIKQTGSEEVTRFLSVDYIESIQDGVAIAKHALSAMNLSHFDKYTVYYDGYLQHDVLSMEKNK